MQTAYLNCKNKINYFQKSTPLALVAFGFLLSLSQQSLGCLSALQGGNSVYLAQATGSGDLCALADRYARAADILRQNKIDALRIAEVRAPRLAKPAHWEAYKRENRTSNPINLYTLPHQPRQSTWTGWDMAAQTTENYAKHYYDQINNGTFRRMDLSAEMTRSLHYKTLHLSESQTAGRWRTGIGISRAFSRDYAHTEEEIRVGTTSTYRNMLSAGRIMTWESTACTEDLTPEERRLIPVGREFELDLNNLPRRGGLFIDARGQRRQCGYFVYAAENEIQPQISALQDDVNGRMRRLSSSQGRYQPANDPLFIASRAQRWFVSLHPFVGGNGRTSRLLMDQILLSVGLPPALIADVDLDFVTTEENWAVEIAKGVEKTVRFVESCAQNHRAPQCAAY